MDVKKQTTIVNNTFDIISLLRSIPVIPNPHQNSLQRHHRPWRRHRPLSKSLPPPVGPGPWPPFDESITGTSPLCALRNTGANIFTSNPISGETFRGGREVISASLIRGRRAAARSARPGYGRTSLSSSRIPLPRDK